MSRRTPVSARGGAAQAVPRRPLPLPRLPDGQKLPADVKAMLLLVLDRDGKPVRGHVLDADPETAGAAFLNNALAAEFQPRLVDGQPVESNVVLAFSSGRFQHRTLRGK